MLKLKDLLEVCTPDQIETKERIGFVFNSGVPKWMHDCPVTGIDGWDDGLTVSIDIPYDTAKAAILRVFSFSAVGSALHIVLDDENVDDSHIKWCIKETIPEIEDDEARTACEECADILLWMDKKSRKKVVHDYGREWW